MDDIAVVRRGLAAAGIVVAAIQGQMLLAVGPFHDHRVQQVRQLLHIGAIRFGKDTGDGYARAVRQEMAFGAAFGAVGGVGSGLLRLACRPVFPSGAFTKHPSAACPSQSRPTSWSYAWNTTAQARCQQPCSTHSWKRACTVDLAPKTRGKA